MSAAVAFAAVLAWALSPPSETPFFDYLAERRASGLPTTFDELAGPPPTDAENGAADVEAAIQAIFERHGPSSSWTGSPYDSNLLIDDDQDGPTSQQLAPLHPIVARMRPELDRLSAALAKPRISFPPHLDAKGPFPGMPSTDHVQVIQNAQRILVMPACAEDDPKRRLSACRDLLLLASRIERASSIDGMVAMTCAAAGVSTLRRGIQLGALDPIAARDMCDALLRTSWLDDTRRGFRAEPVGIIEHYRALLDGRAVPPWSQPSVSQWARARHRLERLAARFDGDAFDAPWDLEPHMARVVVNACRDWEAAAVGDTRAAFEPVAVARAGPGSVASKVSRILRSALRADAQMRLARVGLAVAEHRAKHGEFPVSLDDLKQAFPDGVPHDPFADAPFDYERTAAGVRIASAGPAYVQPPLTDAALRGQGLVWELKR